LGFPGLALYTRIYSELPSSVEELEDKLTDNHRGLDVLFEELRAGEEDIDTATEFVDTKAAGLGSLLSFAFPVKPSLMPSPLRTPSTEAFLRSTGAWSFLAERGRAQDSPFARLANTGTKHDARTRDGVLRSETVSVELAVEAHRREALLQKQVAKGEHDRAVLEANREFILLAESDGELSSGSDDVIIEDVLPLARVAGKKASPIQGYRLVVLRTTPAMGTSVLLRCADTSGAKLDWTEGVSSDGNIRAAACLDASRSFNAVLLASEVHVCGCTQELQADGSSILYTHMTYTARSGDVFVDSDLVPVGQFLQMVTDESGTLLRHDLGRFITSRLSGMAKPALKIPSTRLAKMNIDQSSAMAQLDEESILKLIEATLKKSRGDSKGASRPPIDIATISAHSLFEASGSLKVLPTKDVLGTLLQSSQSLVGSGLSSFQNLNPFGTHAGDRHLSLVALVMNDGTCTLFGPELLLDMKRAGEGLVLRGTDWPQYAPVAHLERTFQLRYMIFLWNGLLMADYLLAPLDPQEDLSKLTKTQLAERERRGVNARFFRQRLRLCIGLIRAALALPEVFKKAKTLDHVSDVNVLQRLKTKVMQHLCKLDLSSTSFGGDDMMLLEMLMEGIPDVPGGEPLFRSESDGLRLGFQSELTGQQVGDLRDWIVRQIGQLSVSDLVTSPVTLASLDDVSRMISSAVANVKVKDTKTPAASALPGKTALPEAARPGAAAAINSPCPACGGPESQCGGYKSATGWKCTRLLQTNLGKGAKCDRWCCTAADLQHIRLGPRGTPCADGNIAMSAPHGKEWQAAHPRS